MAKQDDLATQEAKELETAEQETPFEKPKLDNQYDIEDPLFAELHDTGEVDPDRGIPADVLKDGKDNDPGPEGLEFDDNNAADDDPAEGDLDVHAADDTPAADDQIPVADGEGGQEAHAGGSVDFPEYLLRAAGIDAQQAEKNFQTPEALQAAVRMLDERYLTAGQQQYIQQQQPGVQQQQQQTDDQNAGQAKDEFVLPELEDGAEWGEETKLLVDSLNKHYQSKLSAQQQQLAKQSEAVQAVLRQKTIDEGTAYVAAFDKFLEGLGEDWQATFGVGTGFEIPSDSLFLQNRTLLDQTASTLKETLAQRGQTDLSREDLLMRSLSVAFPDVQKQTVRQEVKEELAGRRRQKTARPTQRRSKAVSGEEAASKHVEQWYSDRGMGKVDDDFDYETI